MKKIAVVGGSQEVNFKKTGKKRGIEILFYDGKQTTGQKYKKQIIKLVEKADEVVVLLGACCHSSMNLVKEACKEQKIPIHYHQGFGVTGALNKVLVSDK